MQHTLWNQSRQHPAGFRDASPSAVVESNEPLRLIDVREPHEFETGRIPGAELVPLGQLVARSQSWDRSQTYVMICRSGGRSAQAAAYLASHGFERVINMAGGMLHYEMLGLDLERAA